MKNFIGVLIFCFIFIQCKNDKRVLNTKETVPIDDTVIVQNKPISQKSSLEDVELDSISAKQNGNKLQLDTANNSFLQNEKYITIDTDSEEINRWILKRIETAKSNIPELVQIPISFHENTFGNGAKVAMIPTIMEYPDPIWIDPILKNKRYFKNGYITGYFTGEPSNTISSKTDKIYTFQVLNANNNPNRYYYRYPKILNKQLYENFQLLKNIEIYEYSLLYDGIKYNILDLDLPKAQLAIQHKDSQIEIVFKGLSLPTNISQQQYVQLIINDTKNYKDLKTHINNEEGWLFLEGNIPDSDNYLIFKKWFFEEDSWTFTIEMEVPEKQLEIAHSILSDFNAQIIPERK